MATSTQKCFVRYESGGWGVGNDPASSSLVRDGYVENACHLADSAGQVRVAWSSKGTALTAGDSVDKPAKIVSFGPFPLTLREDGSSFRMRVRLHATCSTVADQLVHLVLGDGSRAEAETYIAYSATSSANPNHLVYRMTSATTPGWVDVYSPSLIDYAYLRADQTAPLLQSVSSPGAVSGASMRATSVYMAHLSVYAYQTSANAISINAVYAAEYVGT